MKTVYFLLFISILIISCDKNDIEISVNANVKTKYIYSSSTSPEPYAKTTYNYDHHWNLVKELHVDLPHTPTSSYTYQYDSQDRLINKKYNFKSGLNHSGQTEAVFEVTREYRYEYQDDLQIELFYSKGILKDSAVYKYFDDLVIEEYHYDLEDGQKWGILSEYNGDGNIIRKTDIPDNHESVYIYEDSKLIRTISYKDGMKSSEIEYYYSWSGNKEIVECGRGDFMSSKVTYVNGNVIEHIRYHPTFQGSEWFCHRYEYY